MPLRFLLDEHLRGPLWWAIQRHNSYGVDQIDTVRVGDSDCPALGSSDWEILIWAEQAKTILITLDESTMPDHLACIAHRIGVANPILGGERLATAIGT